MEFSLPPRRDSALDLARTTRRALRLTLGLLAVVSAAALLQMRDATRSSLSVLNGHDVLHELNRVQEVTAELRVLEADVISAGDVVLLEHFRELMTELDSARAALRTALADSPQQKHRLDTLDGLAMANARAVTNGMPSEAGVRVLREISDLQRRMEREQRQLLLARSRSMRRETIGVAGAMAGAMLLALLLGITAQRLIESELRRRAHAEEERDRMAEEVAVQAEELQAQNDELMESSEQLQAAQRQAEAANRAKGDFLAVMSHELRTPLNAMIGFGNVLRKNKRGTLDETDILYLERIGANATHLLALINQVLDLAKIDAGHVDVALEPTDVGEVARAVVRQLEGQLRSTAVRLQVDVAPDLAPISTDPAKLQQVLINLVGNAIKFTHAGTVAVRVVGDEAGSPARIEVADTGIGMSPERALRIFDEFEQGGAEVGRQYGGTGLGLSISRALCDALGHELTVASVLGEGSTFTIELSPSRIPRTVRDGERHEDVYAAGSRSQ